MSSEHTRFVQLSTDEFRARLAEALDLYVSAMRYPAGTAQHRAPMWLTHSLREEWRCVAAFGARDDLLGLAYGYRGQQGQWWHEQVRQGLLQQGGEQAAHEWLGDYFELTEIHVLPQRQGAGLGEDLLRRLLTGVARERVLLSTPEGTSRAWNLYRRLGFVDVLRDHHFAGDPRHFAILGRDLPLESVTHTRPHGQDAT